MARVLTKYWSILKKIKIMHTLMSVHKEIKVKQVKDHWKNQCMRTWTKKNRVEIVLPRINKNPIKHNLKMMRSIWWSPISWRKKPDKYLLIMMKSKKLINFMKEFGAKKNKREKKKKRERKLNKNRKRKNKKKEKS